MMGELVPHSTLESVIVAPSDRRVRYTASVHFGNPKWTPNHKALDFDQDGTLQHIMLDNGIHPIDSTVPRSTSSTLIPTAPETRINGNHGVSPDGSLVAIGSAGSTGQTQIYVVPMAGGIPKRVTSSGSVFFDDWSPDGKDISFSAQHDDSFDSYTIPITRGRETLLASRCDAAEFSRMVTGSIFRRTAPPKCRSGVCTRMRVGRSSFSSAALATGSRMFRRTSRRLPFWHTSPAFRVILPTE
jgi:hypothetical protein